MKRRQSGIKRICILIVFTAAAKVCANFQVIHGSINFLALQLTQSFFISELLTFNISEALTVLSYYLLTNVSAWVGINIIWIITIVTRGKILRLSATCKINSAASKNLENFI